MRRYTVGLVRVLTTGDPDVLEAHGRWLGACFPGLEVVSVCIAGQPCGIYDEESEQRAVPGIVAAGEALAGRGVEAVMVSCAADPGVTALRQRVQVPVIGAGAAAAAAALALGTPVGVLGITEHAPAAMKAVLGAHLVAACRPAGVETTLDLAGPWLDAALAGAGAGLVAAGARVLALGCTGMSLPGTARRLSLRLGVPVVDPVLAAGAMVLWALADAGGGKEALP
ncbi:MAG: aspartate/glutamate racemase family protein [Bacillota bacterium]